jgi:hypothetical protein
MWWLLLDASSAYQKGRDLGVATRPYAGVAVAITLLIAVIDWIRERRNR